MNLNVSPEWLELRAVIVGALEPHPAAHRAVLRALEGVGKGVSLAEDLKLALDRVAFARSIGFEPDEWQAEALRSTALRQLYNASRRSGKSTVAAVLAVHTALYDPTSLVLLVSPTLRQSQELFRKCLGFYAASSKPVPPESETALTLTLENASRIVSLPGGKGHTAVRATAPRSSPRPLRRMIRTSKRKLEISPALPHAQIVEEELRTFTGKVSEAGHYRYEGREREHDDLVLALSLATWYRTYMYRTVEASMAAHKRKVG